MNELKSDWNPNNDIWLTIRLRLFRLPHFPLPGYGMSSGVPSELNVYADIEAAYELVS